MKQELTTSYGRLEYAISLGALTLVALTACQASSAPAPTGWAASTSAGGGAGMAALIIAATGEGQVNVIGLPHDWVNYGALINGFEAKYPGIKVNSLEPNDTSQLEIDAIKKPAADSPAPDVVDLGMKVASANTALFAPYKVGTWQDIPSNQKDSKGLWVQDYGGYMSVGYDSTKVPGGVISSIQDLRGPEFKAKVALVGDPRKSDEALSSVLMAAEANGGSLDDLSNGVDFFRQLYQSGNLAPVPATIYTVRAGRTPVVFEWDYLSFSHLKDVSGWKIFTPQNALVANYYAQAINRQAPHPAAARLWEEYLYSDEGQNLWLKGGARPVRQAAMTAAGTIDPVAAAVLPLLYGTPQFITRSQSDAAAAYAQANWAQAVS